MEETGSKAPAEPQVCGVNKQEEQMGPIGKSCKCLAEHKALKNTKERLFNMHKIRWSCKLSESLLKTRTGKKPYSCFNCTKSFDLQSHLHTHFTLAWSLTAALSILSYFHSQLPRRFIWKVICSAHTSEKPYSWSMCPKLFALFVNLHSYFKVHTGERHLASIPRRPLLFLLYKVSEGSHCWRTLYLLPVYKDILLVLEFCDIIWKYRPISLLRVY